MKKLITVLIISFTLVLCSCGQQPTIDIDNTISQLENVETDNEDKGEKHYWIVNYNCLPKDESKGEAYNAAISAYNEFLAQKAEETLEWFNEDDKGLTGPLPYVYLKDLHGDGIPEIIVRLDPVYPEQVFSYIDDVVVELAGPRSNNMHGGCYLRENGMYISEHITTGWFNSFVTYNVDGTQTIEYFWGYKEKSYEKYTVASVNEIHDEVKEDYYVIVFENTEEGEQRFYDMYAPYKELLELPPMELGESYSPYVMQ